MNLPPVGIDPITITVIAIAVNTFAGAIQDVINCFKYSNSTVFEKYIKGEGFSYYEADATSRLTSIPYKYYDRWSERQTEYEFVPQE